MLIGCTRGISSCCDTHALDAVFAVRSCFPWSLQVRLLYALLCFAWSLPYGACPHFVFSLAVYVTWWFLRFFDNFFSVGTHAQMSMTRHIARAPVQSRIGRSLSLHTVVQPVYFALLGFHVFGLGFVTSMVSAQVGTAKCNHIICSRACMNLTVLPAAGLHLHDRGVCIILGWWCPAVSWRVDHQEAAADQTHLLGGQASDGRAQP
jgi:hypothetical protein